LPAPDGQQRGPDQLGRVRAFKHPQSQGRGREAIQSQDWTEREIKEEQLHEQGRVAHELQITARQSAAQDRTGKPQQRGREPEAKSQGQGRAAQREREPEALEQGACGKTLLLDRKKKIPNAIPLPVVPQGSDAMEQQPAEQGGQQAKAQDVAERPETPATGARKSARARTHQV
jgi:hypothetical protein